MDIYLVDDLRIDTTYNRNRSKIQRLWAEALAQKTHGRIILVHALSLATYSPNKPYAIYKKEVVADRYSRLEITAAKMQPTAKIKLVLGPPAMMLSKLFEKRRDALGIIASNTADYKNALLGSVAEEIVRRSRVPILNIGPKVTHFSLSDEPILLLATDLTKANLRAERFAIQLAQLLGARLQVVSACSSRTHASKYLTCSTSMKRVEEDIRRAGLEANSDLVVSKKFVFEEILAKSGSADLIVMGTRSKHFLLQGFFGSTARDVITSSSIPVITVSP